MQHEQAIQQPSLDGVKNQLFLKETVGESGRKAEREREQRDAKDQRVGKESSHQVGNLT